MRLGPVLINLLHVIYKGHLPNPLAGLFHLGLASHPPIPRHRTNLPLCMSSYFHPISLVQLWGPHLSSLTPYSMVTLDSCETPSTPATHPNLVPGTRIGSGRQTIANTCVSNSGPAYTTLGSQGLNSALTCLF